MHPYITSTPYWTLSKGGRKLRIGWPKTLGIRNNQVRAFGGEPEAAFTIGLAPQLSPAAPDKEIDHLELSNYLRCWDILTVWAYQVVSGMSGQLDYIVRMLPILSSRDNPKD